MTSKSSDCSELACSSYRRPNKTDNMCYFVRYVIYGTRAVVSRLIQHSALPRAVSASRPHPSSHKLRNALVAHIIYYVVHGRWVRYKMFRTTYAQWHLYILMAYTRSAMRKSVTVIISNYIANAFSHSWSAVWICNTFTVFSAFLKASICSYDVYAFFLREIRHYMYNVANSKRPYCR